MPGAGGPERGWSAIEAGLRQWSRTGVECRARASTALVQTSSSTDRAEQPSTGRGRRRADSGA